MIPAEFHFLRPWWLLALMPLAVVVWLLLKRRLGSRGWESFCDPVLLPYILSGGGGRTGRWPAILTGISGLLAVIALAGPVWNKLPQPVFSSQAALVIALDLSRSMAADDISPSRLGRARFKIRDLLEQRPEGRTGLLVYAGDAFTVTPLTGDTRTIVSQLQALSPDIMPVHGHRADLALRHAGKLMQQAGAGRGNVLLITDEVEPDRGAEAAAELNDRGYRVSVIGVGSDHGVPIPLGDGSFLKNEQGEIVIPTLNEKPLRQVAAAGGGIYVRLQKSDADVSRLVDVFRESITEQMQATELETDVWREQGPWLLLPLLVLAALAFRRGYLVALLCLVLPFPQNARAFDWDGLWQRDDQRARQALEQGDNKTASELFSDPAWKGVADYRSGDYAAAARALEGLEEADNLYNLGNALARTGRYQAAIEAYDKALEKDPDNEDAKYNRKLVEEALKQQQQQKNQQSQQGQQGKEQKQQQQNRNQGGGQQDKQGSDRQESESGRRQQSQQQERQSEQEQKQQQQQQKDSTRRGEAEKEQREPEQQQQDRQQPSDQRQARAPVDEMQPDEEQQAVEQWLRRIPDDPGELLRRKFRYQYQQRQQRSGEDQSW